MKVVENVLSEKRRIISMRRFFIENAGRSRCFSYLCRVRRTNLNAHEYENIENFSCRASDIRFCGGVGSEPKAASILKCSVSCAIVYKNTAEDKALRNALAGTDIQKLASNA